MSDRAEELIADVKDQIGLDAYHIYPESRRMIPDAVLWAFASACILEFVKAFVDLKGLGEATRNRIGRLLAKWKAKNLDDVAVDDLASDVAEAIAALPRKASPAEREAGILRLQAALLELGLSSDGGEASCRFRGRESPRDGRRLMEGKLYGGMVIEGAMFPALERIAVGFNVADLEVMNATLFGVEAMVQEYDPDDPRRIWWHWVHKGNESWVSINPGEFRRNPPAPSDVGEGAAGRPRGSRLARDAKRRHPVLQPSAPAHRS